MKRNFDEFNSNGTVGSDEEDFDVINESFLTELQTWVNSAIEDDEKKNREEVQERMIEVMRHEYTELSLDGLALSSLPKGIESLDFLTSLDLSDNEFELFPLELLKLNSLETLSFGGNQLKTLPPEIRDLVNLKDLFLGDNELETIPAEIGSLAALINLYLDDNNLKRIPEEISGLSNLITLDLSDNPELESSTELLAILSDLEGRRCDIRYPEQFSFDPLFTKAESRLALIATKYKTTNSIEATNPIPNTTALLHRFLTEGIEQRGGIGQILQATTSTLDILAENPNHLKWVEEIASNYLAGCVNQPVGGWSEISALASIAAAPTMLEKLESAKHLLVNDRVKEFVGRTFKGARVEIEAGNALLREEHATLVSDGLIKKPWLAVPGPIAYEETIGTWLRENAAQFHNEIKPLLEQRPEEIAELLLGTRRLTWGEINFPEQLKEISNSYEQERSKSLESIEDEIKKISKGPDREDLVKVLTTKLDDDQKILAEKNQDLVLEEIAKLTRSMLATELQAMGVRSLAAGAGAAAEFQSAANQPPSTTTQTLASSRLEEGSERMER